MKLSIRQTGSLQEVATATWNALDTHGNPFLRHEFLAGLEQYNCLDDHGWYPCHLLAERDGELVGALPLYFKTNSIGEFVFDWNWAEAYEHAGGHYYPKLVSAVPFTPVTGPRYLVRPDAGNPEDIQDALFQAARSLAEEAGVSGLHFLFPDDVDHQTFIRQGLLIRGSYQYHWFNHDYRDFDDFLFRLSAKKRKQIKRERRVITESGIRIEVLRGEAITPRHWSAYYRFYTSTFDKKWGNPRFTLDFFQSLSNRLPGVPLLFLASHGKTCVAGAFAMQGEDVLYGRHWGCHGQFPFLHFELCYYQTIDYCIRHRIGKLDAGVQGEHKISRGFIPVNTWSAHWIANNEFRHAIEHYLNREQAFIEHYMKELSGHLAYKAS